MIVAKIHRAYRSVVAVCDADIVGKYFEEGKYQLDLRENFFKDTEITYAESVKLFKDQIKEDATFNIVGHKSIQAAIDAGIITKDSVNYIAKIPFTLILF